MKILIQPLKQKFQYLFQYNLNNQLVSVYMEQIEKSLIVLFLLLFGANKIPELARGLGRGIREFKEATKEIKDEIESGTKDKK